MMREIIVSHAGPSRFAFDASRQHPISWNNLDFHQQVALIYEMSRGPPATSVWTLCIAGVTFLQPQGTGLGLHSLRPLLDVFSQETNLAPRKRGLFFSLGNFTEDFLFRKLADANRNATCFRVSDGSASPIHSAGVHWRSVPMVSGPE
jgi:hypothetical protein